MTTESRMQRRKKGKHESKAPNKKKKKKIIILSIIIAVLLVIVIGICFVYYKLGKVKRVDIKKDNASLQISNEAQQEADKHNNNIINLAFFGVDSREAKVQSRSDSIMIVTIDKEHKKVKMSSVMRDTYVDIKGHGKTKITDAFQYGGPQLAISTLNSNFGLDIRNFVAVDFFDLGKIIDELGGVSIKLTADEVKYINPYIAEVSKLENKKPPYIYKPGTYQLNGIQAVAYCRIRYTVGWDYKRTERQRDVLMALFNKIKAMGKLQFANEVTKLLPYVQTSMTSNEIISTGLGAFDAGVSSIDQQRFPLDKQFTEQTINKEFFIVPDADLTKESIRKFIYDDINPTK